MNACMSSSRIQMASRVVATVAAISLAACSQRDLDSPSTSALEGTPVAATTSGTPHRAMPVPPCKPEDGVDACRRFCKFGSHESCAYAGVLLLQAGTLEDAQGPLVDSCGAGIALGCGALGSLHGLKNDWKTAREYLEKGCSMGDGVACESLGGIEHGFNSAQPPADPTQAFRNAVPLYRRACDMGVSRGCGWVAAGITDGAIDGSLKEALGLYVKACGGHPAMPVACRQAAGILQMETPESRELARDAATAGSAAGLLKRGCELGDEESCELLHKLRGQ
jgi:TPR repeat protein